MRACVRVVGGGRSEGKERGARTVWYVTGRVDRVERQPDLVFETPPACIHVRTSNEDGKQEA